MEYLPDLALLKIFDHFPLEERLLSLDLVCDRWNRLMPYKIYEKRQKTNDSSKKIWETNLEVTRLTSYIAEGRPSNQDKDSIFDFLNSLLKHTSEKIGDHLTSIIFCRGAPFFEAIRGWHFESVLLFSSSVSVLKFCPSICLKSDSVEILPRFVNLRTLALTATEENRDNLANALSQLHFLKRLRIGGQFGQDLVLGDGSSIIRVTIGNLRPFERCLANAVSSSNFFPISGFLFMIISGTIASSVAQSSLFLLFLERRNQSIP